MYHYILVFMCFPLAWSLSSPVSPQFCFFLMAALFIFHHQGDFLPSHGSPQLSFLLSTLSFLSLPPTSLIHTLSSSSSLLLCLSLRPTFSPSPSALTLNLSSSSLSNVLKLKLHSELVPFYLNVKVSRSHSTSLEAGSRGNPSKV